jgi:hypothetical protein
MNVKETRELLSKLPEGLTQEQFDELELVFTVDGFNFQTPCEGESGHISFQGICLKDGETIPDTPPENLSTINVFALMPHNITQILEERGEITVEDVSNESE